MQSDKENEKSKNDLMYSPEFVEKVYTSLCMQRMSPDIRVHFVQYEKALDTYRHEIDVLNSKLACNIQGLDTMRDLFYELTNIIRKYERMDNNDKL